MYKEIPVYVYNGFLEAGKTAYIQQCLEGTEFGDEKRILLLVCEEGEEEYAPDRFRSPHVFIETLKDRGEIREKNLDALAKKHGAETVIIEFNGMWNVENLFYCLPAEWTVYDEVFIADAESFVPYNTNLRQQTYEKLKTCDRVIFNRFGESADLMPLHKIVRGTNTKCRISYEKRDGTVLEDGIIDPPPFHMEDDTMIIEDKDFAVWFRNMREQPERYEGRYVRVKGLSGNGPAPGSGQFLILRQVMVCCEADIETLGIACLSESQNCGPGEWVTVTARIRIEKGHYGNAEPALMVEKIEPAKEPDVRICTFY